MEARRRAPGVHAPVYRYMYPQVCGGAGARKRRHRLQPAPHPAQNGGVSSATAAALVAAGINVSPAALPVRGARATAIDPFAPRSPPM